MIIILNKKSLSSMTAGSRARMGSFGEDLSKGYEYKIYVYQDEYERACALIGR
ncbi:hypothetical protein [Anaerotignum sp.]